MAVKRFRMPELTSVVGSWPYPTFWRADTEAELSSVAANNGDLAYGIDTGKHLRRVGGAWTAIAPDTPPAHHTTHESGGTDAIKLDDLSAADDNTDLDASTAKHGLMQKYPGGTTNFLRADGSFATPPGGAGALAYIDFTKDLGAGQSSGTFDITGLSGLTADKIVSVIQTAAKITSKGDARDEPEMDQIRLTGYVVDANTIRCYWQAPSVVVGTYAFAFQVST